MSNLRLRRLFSCGLLLAAVAFLAQPAGAGVNTTGNWVPQGPRPITNGQVEGATVVNGAVVGALHAVACHPTDANIAYVGGVHGGIWRTNDAQAVNPTWTPQIDTAADLAIADIEFDPTDPTANTLVAGVGYMSSYYESTTSLGGVWRTTNGGTSWTLMGDANIQGENVVGVEARGNTIVAGSNGRRHWLDGVFGAAVLGTGQLMRSTDGGVSWNLITGAPGTLAGGGAFPAGLVYDVAGDPTNNMRLYCGVAGVGIFRSDDTGATWQNISGADVPLNTVITTPGAPIPNNNTEFAVANNGRLFAAVMINAQLSYIGYTDNPGAVAPLWVRMDTPQVITLDNTIEGIQPRAKPGSQGDTHFSMAADPNNPNIVYVGGDRQENNDGPPAPSEWPNVIGANDYSASIWRGNTVPAPTGLPFSPQWAHMTHSNAIALIPGGGTASGSAPHADSRGMDFDAVGNLIEVDDAGVYRRTLPGSNAGDWFTINGNLQVTEAHDVAYDTVSNIIMSGNQDTGTSQQMAPNSFTWTSIPITPAFTYQPWAGAPLSTISFSTGDGADVRVDSVNPAGGSTRYSSFQRFGLFRRQTYSGAGAITGQAFPTFAGGAFTAQFKTPFALNAVTPTRIAVGWANAVSESVDQGNTAAVVPGGGGVNRPDAMAYGGTNGGVPNPDVLYIGTGNQIRIRTTAGGNLTASATWTGGYAHDIVLDPDDWMTAYVVVTTAIWRTTDAGTTWTNITGDLGTVGGVDFVCAEYIRCGNDDSIAVGTRTGVYVTNEAALGTWAKLGMGLPSARVWDMQYDQADNVLVVSTMGRGVFKLTDVADQTPPVITCSVLRKMLWPARRGMIPVGLSASAVDANDPNPTVTVSVYSDEPDGAAPFNNDATGTAPANTRLRMERAYPGGNGRVYLIVVKAVDACGNESVTCKTVTVPLMPVGFYLVSVRNEAAAAELFCLANNGAPPVAWPATALLTYTAP